MVDPLTEIVRLNIEGSLARMGRTQRELAEYCDKSESWLSLILSGKRGVRLCHLGQIARFCGLSVATLFSIDGHAYRERRRFERRMTQDRRMGVERRKLP